MALIAYIVFSAGFLLLRLADAADMPAPAAWVLGIFTTAIALAALVFAFELLAASAFIVWAVLVIGLEIVMRRSASAPRRLERGELVALLLCAAATAYWCRGLAEVPQILWRDGVMTTWVDQFIHGSVISQFGDPRAAGRQHVELADVAREPYHYASYMLPAVLVWPLDLPGLTLATSVWVPLGFLTVCAGAYALGAALAGPSGACAALSTRVVQRRVLLFASGALVVFAVFVWGFYRAFPDAPHALGIFLDVTHNQQQPVAYRGLYADLMAFYGAQVAVPVGVLLVLASTLGVFGIFYPVSVLAARRARRFELIDLVPVALLGSYLDRKSTRLNSSH